MRSVRVWYTSSVRAALVALTVATALCSAAAPVGAARMAGHARPIRIEGYWDRTKSDAAVIGEATISASGHPRREFGITAIQAYKPEEEGAHILRHSSQRPSTLLLAGPKEMVEKFFGARPDEKVTAFGLYRAGAGQLVLSSVEVAEAAKTAATAPAH